MKTLKRIIGLILLVAIALIIIAFVLPRYVSVDRSVVINAKPEVIFPYINSPKKHELWSPWLARDPDTKMTYSGPEAGIGSKMEWASDHKGVGNGGATIIKSTENQSIETVLDFGPEGAATAFFTLSPESEGTSVTWGFTTDMGMNPIGRWMGLMMDKWVGGDYEQGLNNLKALVESQ